MKKGTLKALKKSIQKWHGIAYYDEEDQGAGNCALCDLFFDQLAFSFTDCDECPVKDETHRSYCDCSPYIDFVFAEENGTKEALRLAAVKELKFLVTLLPLGESVEMDDGWVWYRSA